MERKLQNVPIESCQVVNFFSPENYTHNAVYHGGYILYQRGYAREGLVEPGAYPLRTYLERLRSSWGGSIRLPYIVHDTSATYMLPSESTAMPWGA